MSFVHLVLKLGQYSSGVNVYGLFSQDRPDHILSPKYLNLFKYRNHTVVKNLWSSKRGLFPPAKFFILSDGSLFKLLPQTHNIFLNDSIRYSSALRYQIRYTGVARHHITPLDKVIIQKNERIHSNITWLPARLVDSHCSQSKHRYPL